MKAKKTGGSQDSSRRAKAAADKGIAAVSDSSLKNGYVGGDRTRSSSSHQFHEDGDRKAD